MLWWPDRSVAKSCSTSKYGTCGSGRRIYGDNLSVGKRLKISTRQMEVRMQCSEIEQEIFPVYLGRTNSRYKHQIAKNSCITLPFYGVTQNSVTFRAGKTTNVTLLRQLTELSEREPLSSGGRDDSGH